MKTHYFITTKNIGEFLKSIERGLPFRAADITAIQPIEQYGNSNYLWRVAARAGKREVVCFVKQARTYNKRAWEKNKKKITVDPLRIYGEKRMMILLRKLWGKGVVPEVYYFDPKRLVLVMSDVGARGTLLVDEFFHDRIHSELGGSFGRLFGKLHASTYEERRDCCGSPRWRRKLMSLFGMWWFGTGIMQHLPAARIRAFYREARCAPHAWIWGDPVIRNIFVKPGGKVSMVDFDHALLYDPAFDCGLLLAQWMWMGLKNAKLKIQSAKFIGGFWRMYAKEFEKKKLGGEIEAIRKRADRWAGMYLVSRVDGRSGSYFAEWPAWEKKIRALGLALFSKE